MSTRTKRRLAVGAAYPVLGGVVWYLYEGLGLAALTLVLVVALGALEALVPDEEGGGHVERSAIRRSFWVGLLLPLGLGLLYVSERIVGAAHELIWAWRALPLLALAATVGWRGYALSRARGNQRQVEVALAAATGGVLAALALYALGTESGVAAMGFEDSGAERMRGVLGVLWPATLVVSLAALFAMEMAYRVMPVEEAIELRRVSAAAGTGLSIALSLVFVASMSYVATERDVTRDLSYFKTTRPGEQTLRMVERLDEPMRVVLFYPPVNEVLERLRPYFDELDAASDALSVEVQDHALSFELAQRHRVSRNGFVMILRGPDGEGQQAEQFEVGVELESARSRLRTLDARFQQHFARLATRPRDLHLTVGHRERSASPTDGDAEGERLSELSTALQRSNIQSRNLGVAEGLANEVPENARAVAVIGPRSPFLPEEAQSLLRYVGRGGRLLVFVDPDVDHGLDPLLHGLGVSIPRGVLTSSTHHMRRRTGEADRLAVYSNAYTAHPTVTLANRYRSQVVSVFLRGGAIERREGAELRGAAVTFPLRTEGTFWLDTDGDLQRGAEEPEGRFNMIAAITVPVDGGEEGRAVVIADGDFITDQLIGNRGNGFVLMDAVNWLVGEEQVLGPTQTEEDVPIRHTREEDELWFYATSFGAPIPLLLVGVWLAWRRREGKRRETTPKGAPEAAASGGAAAAPAEERPTDREAAADEHAAGEDAPTASPVAAAPREEEEE
ncbi:MAG: hypothetical protein KF729_12765 [Sandaracinaceae bacterium]|nr:hypothetical protein [Sandaracinaceae bacterium]